MWHMTDIALEGWFCIGIYDIVDYVLGIMVQVRRSWLGWDPATFFPYEANQDKSTSVVGKRKNCLREVGPPLFLRKIESTLKFSVQVFPRVC